MRGVRQKTKFEYYCYVRLGQKFVGLDWQLALAKLIIVALILTGFYIKGRGDGKASCEKK